MARRVPPQLLAASCLLAIVAPLGTATADPPTDPFAVHGLAVSGSVLILPGTEADLHAGIRALRAARAKFDAEADVRRTQAHRLKVAQDRLDATTAEFAYVSRQIVDAADDNARDPLKAQSNVLDAQRRRLAEALAAVVRQGQLLATTRSDYLRLGLEVGDAADAAKGRYDRLAADADLTAALARRNQGQPPAKAVRLGPSAAMQDDLKFAATCRAELATSPVPVDMSAGVPMVDVVLNGREQLQMVWDSGATMVNLSARAAAAAGVRPTANDPTVRTRLANGRTVTTTRVMLRTVQVGAFVAHDVPCEVHAADEDAPNLLGNSFQGRFVCRLDPSAGMLSLTTLKADPPPDVGAPPRHHSWDRPALPFQPGLLGQVFADDDLTTPVVTRIDRQLSFDWQAGTIDPGVDVGHFAARWAGAVRLPQSGQYTFACASDDGSATVTLDGRTIIDAHTAPQADVRLPAGLHPIRVAYASRTPGAGRLHLTWAQRGGWPLQPLPVGALVHRSTDEPMGTVPPDPGWRTELAGTPDGDPFRDDAPAGAVLVGFEVTTADQDGVTVVRSVRSLYHGPDGDCLGRTFGHPTERVVRAVARPGYTVAKVAVEWADQLNGLTVRFARLNADGSLSPSDLYDGVALGGHTENRTVLGCGVRPIVGVYGSAGDEPRALGLVEDR